MDPTCIVLHRRLDYLGCLAQEAGVPMPRKEAGLPKPAKKDGLPVWPIA